MKRNSLFWFLTIAGCGVGLSAGILPATAEAVVANGSLTTAEQASTTDAVLIIDPTSGNDRSGDGSERSPFKTITQALQLAQENTVLLLRPGTYSQESGEQFPIQLKAGVTLYGNPQTRGQEVVIRGSGLFLSPAANRQSVTVLVTTPVAITGVTITNPDANGTGLWIESANAAVESNTLAGSGQTGLKVVGRRSAPRISSNFFTQNGRSGLVLSGTSEAEVEGNIIESTGTGVLVEQQATPTIRQNRITENTEGIVVHAGAKPTLQNNSVERNQRSGASIATAPSNALPVGGMGSDTFTVTAATASAAASPVVNAAASMPSLPSKELAPQITFGQKLSQPTSTLTATKLSNGASTPVTAMPTVVVKQAAAVAPRRKSVAISQISKNPPELVAAVPQSQPVVTPISLTAAKPQVIEFAQPLPEQSNGPLLQSVVGRPVPLPRLAPVVVRPIQPRPQPVTLNVMRSQSSSPAVINIPVPAPDTPIVRSVPRPTPRVVATASSPATRANLTTLQLLPVPGPNIPLGNAGNSPEVAIYQAPPRRSDGINPPTPPMQISRLSLRYRVVVPIETEDMPSQVRSLVPDAFPTSTNGQRVMQLGAFSDRSKADQLVQSLTNQGVRAILESFE